MPITKDANLGPWKGFIKTDILYTNVFLNPVVLMVFLSLFQILNIHFKKPLTEALSSLTFGKPCSNNREL